MTKRKYDRLYTFLVFCYFTFTEKVVQPDPDGGKKDFDLTKETLHALQEELAEWLCENYAVTDLKFDADSECSFQMQFTFTEKEVQPDPDGGNKALEPTEEALEALQAELAEYLGQNYRVTDVRIHADSDLLLGVVRVRPDAPPHPSDPLT